MTVINFQTLHEPDVSGMSEFVEDFSSSVTTGDQNVTLSLTKGTNRSVKEVMLYIPGAGDAAYFEVHRTDGDPATSSKKGGSKYNASTMIIFDSIETPAVTNLKLKMNTGNAGTVTCYFTVKYYYK